MSSEPMAIVAASEPPLRYALPAHVYASEFPNGTVLLDLKRNRYFGIAARDAAELRGLIDTSPSHAELQIARPDRWLAQHLLELVHTPTRPFAAEGAYSA